MNKRHEKEQLLVTGVSCLLWTAFLREVLYWRGSLGTPGRGHTEHSGFSAEKTVRCLSAPCLDLAQLHISTELPVQGQRCPDPLPAPSPTKAGIT